MSDISGPPVPKPVDPVVRTPGKPSSVSKDPQHSDTQAKNEKGDNSAKSEQSEYLRGRDPAVSISASTAHLEVGEKLKEQIRKVDLEGRPIIVTETATFALRPDAGLRAGDDVRLEIVEAGNKLSADLYEKNGLGIDPPVRLSLVVIAIHTKDEKPAQSVDTGYRPTPAAGYANLSRKDVRAKETPETLLTTMARQLPKVEAPFAESPLLQGKAIETSQFDGIPTKQYPGTTPTRNSREDLATLIAAQQNLTPSRQPLNAQTLPNSELLQRNQKAAGHFIPDSQLTQLDARNQEPGALGAQAPIVAFSPSAQSMTLQLVPSGTTSDRSVANTAQVISVKPTPISEVRNLLDKATPNNAPTSPLAWLETDRGSFVAPLEKVQKLVGQTVLIAPTEITAADAQTATPRYAAQLTPPSGESDRKVLVSFTSPTEGGENQIVTKIRAVHTIRAFVSPGGQMAELRLETPRGDIAVTLPDTVRPVVGDTVSIIPPPVVSPHSAMAAVPPTGTEVTGHAWPALEQSFSLISGTAPLEAAQLAQKSADGGAKLTNSLLFYLSAAGRQSPSAWLGNEVEEALKHQNRPLLETLKHELSKLMTATTDTTSEWRPVILPLEMRGNDLPLIAMLLGQPHRPLDPDDHQGSSYGQQGEGDEPQRFIMEIQFSIIGSIQLDGMIRGHHFDLAMRTERPLSSQLKSDAANLFDAAIHASGFSGKLNIMESTPFPVDLDRIIAGALAS